jgi:hypothetical protein
VQQDRGRLRKRFLTLADQHRRGACRVEPRIVVGQRVAGEDVDGNPRVPKPELREREPDLVAVARGGVVVEAHGQQNATVDAVVRIAEVIRDS